MATSTSDADEHTPLQAKLETVHKVRSGVVAMQVKLITNACSMACGWSFGDALLTTFRTHLTNPSKFPDNPFAVTSLLLVVVLAFAEFFQFLKPKLSIYIILVVQLFFHSIAVCLGRAFHYCFITFAQPATLGRTGWPQTVIYFFWGLLFTALATLVGLLYQLITKTANTYQEHQLQLEALTRLSLRSYKTVSTWSSDVPSLTRKTTRIRQHEDGIASVYSCGCNWGAICRHILYGDASCSVFLKIIGMLVAWCWSDFVKGLSADLFGTDKDSGKLGLQILFYLLYTFVVTVAAAAVSWMIQNLGPITAAAFGLACGFAWKQALGVVTQQWKWEDVLWIEILYFLGVLIVSSILCWFMLPWTAAVQLEKEEEEKASAKLMGLPGPEEKSTLHSVWHHFWTNAVTLASIAFGLNVGWAWGAILDTLIKDNLKKVIANPIVVKLIGSSCILLLACIVVVILAHKAQEDGKDHAMGDAGDGADGD
eukprot:TRINITY_DN68185_c1_g3_i1.p1 TRINITY_DN68185_c1_g3~~TRINITY_DN68185_c1_g3_i1.p1  ORF type:complete len:496 (-),score=13.33 TRINITY_DN68185_c1_g3_i1:161-1606(-)